MPAEKTVASEKKQYHILVVDDDPSVIESVRFSLSEQGHLVTVAYDGNQCIAIAETKTPDMVILDIMMPRRSGFLVLERLRQTIESPLPVIVITANEGSRHREYAQMLGVNEYITKPFNMEQLVASVDDLLTKFHTTD